MITLTITFQGAIPSAKGPAFLSNTIERVTAWELETDPARLRIQQDGGGTFVYNWAAILSVVVDPHGSILKPNLGATA